MGSQSHINHKDSALPSKSCKGNLQNGSRTQPFLNILIIISLRKSFDHGVQIYFTLYLSPTPYDLQWGYLLKIWARTYFPSASIRPDDLLPFMFGFIYFPPPLALLTALSMTGMLLPL